VNPSTSEVLCTTSAEALAMGKFVILPSHPSNDFFAQFPNCLTYTTKEEFVGFLYYALTHSPVPLTKEYSYALTWQAATERLMAAASIPTREAELMAEALSKQEAGIEVRTRCTSFCDYSFICTAFCSLARSLCPDYSPPFRGK
jgi:hypothetical protein